MILSHIVAVSENGVIGKDNKLLWHFTEDLNYFKKRTTGKVMIMGRKTYDSIGKPLPKRFHIVVSRTVVDSLHEQVKYVSSLKEAYALAEKLTLSQNWPDEVMIVGGGQIYRESLADTDFIYLTRIPGKYEGDATYDLNLPKEFGLAFSQFSDAHPGLRYEIWSKAQTIADES
ncbi:MAG: dihydrofolate reductase [Bdellovibrionaceae bacterium]|nr:dihydrofolate reductase [Bdellovibrio sp.]